MKTSIDIWMYLGPPILLPHTPNVITIEVNENEPLELHCPVTVSPDLSVQWSKNNEELDPMWSSSNVLIRRFLLKIHRASSTDGGLYKCNVVNGFGNVQAQFHVIIKCTSSFSLQFSGERFFFFSLANGTSLNKIVNDEQQNLENWDVDSMNGGESFSLQSKGVLQKNYCFCRSTSVSFSNGWQFPRTDQSDSTGRYHCSIQVFSIGQTHPGGTMEKGRENLIRRWIWYHSVS